MSCSRAAYASASGLSIGTLITSSVYGGRLAEMSSNETNAPISMRNLPNSSGDAPGRSLTRDRFIHRDTDHFLRIWRKIGGDVFQRDERPNIHEKSAEQQRRRPRPLFDPLGNLRFGAGVLLGFDGGDGLQDAVRLRETADATFAIFIALGHHSPGVDAVQDVEHRSEERRAGKDSRS